jgi:hypothetical protein
VKPAVAVPLVALAMSLVGCASDTTATTEIPACTPGNDNASNGVVLMAQSVPTATWVPCMRMSPPLGWDFHHLDARNGNAKFFLNSDRDGQKAIEVRLEESCDTAGATEIHSDREGMRRLERVTRTTPNYLGRRYYVFEGGCITFVFRLSGQSRGEPLALATQVVGVVSREDLRDQVHEQSGGRLTLDPPSGTG